MSTEGGGGLREEEVMETEEVRECRRKAGGGDVSCVDSLREHRSKFHAVMSRQRQEISIMNQRHRKCKCVCSCVCAGGCSLCTSRRVRLHVRSSAIFRNGRPLCGCTCTVTANSYFGSSC